MAERRKQFKLESDPTEPVAPHLREVGGAEHVPNVSLTLRMARQRAGYDLKDVAGVLRIRASNLEAIENGRFDDLPGATYITGFLRTYADFLGLDRDEIVARYREEIGAASRQKLSFPTPSQEGRVPRFWIVLVALVLVGVAYGGWHYYTTRNDEPAVTVAEPPADAEITPETAATAPSSESAATSANETSSAASAATGSDATVTGARNSLFENGAASTPGASQGTGAPAVEPEAPKTSPAPAATGGSGTLWDDSSTPANASPTTAVAAAPEPPSATSTASETAATAPAEESDATEAPPEPSNATEAETATAETPPLTAEPAKPAATLAQVRGETTVETLPPPTEAEIAALEQDGGERVAIDAPNPSLPAAVSTSSRIVIGARADSWLQIQGPGNELVMTRILRASESYPVPDRPGLVMVTGNAGGIEIVVDGQAIAPLGPVGVVKRNIALDPDSLRTTFGIANR